MTRDTNQNNPFFRNRATQERIMHDDPKHISTLLPTDKGSIEPMVWEKLRWATEQRLTRDYRTVCIGEEECRWLLRWLEGSKEQKELAKEPPNAR